MEKPDITIIGGCGHVGLPLGLSFAKIEKKIALLDLDQNTIQKINSGIVPFKEDGAQELLTEAIKKKLLLATKSAEVLSSSEFVIIVTGTPLDEHLNPRLDSIFKVLDQYFEYLRDNQVLILRSTVYPTTSQKVHEYFVKKGKNIHVTFCPERIAEGHALKEITTLPQIISGFSSCGIEKVKELFLLLTPKVIHLTPLEAELAKLFTNAYRYIHFSIANQFYQLTSSLNIDFNTIYHAITEDYPRMKHFPKPGFTAGPCLLKDTMQIYAFSDQRFHLGQAAMLINENMPRTIINFIKSKTSIEDKIIGILGMAFKAESDDKRDSLSYKLAKMLRIEAKQVLCSDEHIQDKNFVSTEELMNRAHIIIIATPHKKYSTLSFKKHHQVFDIWNVIKAPYET